MLGHENALLLFIEKRVGCMSQKENTHRTGKKNAELY